MGISNLVNATHGDSSRSQLRLSRTGRQRTFVLRHQDEDSSRLINDESSNVSKEPKASTSREDQTNLNDERPNDFKTRSARSMNLRKQGRFNQENNQPTFRSVVNQSMDRSNDASNHQFSSNIRSKLKSRFKRISVDENLIKKDDEQKEFNRIKNKVDHRLEKTYSWKNRLISIVTGRDKGNQNLITYQNEFDFFTRQSKTIKQPNKLDNLMIDQLRSYVESDHNLYYPSLRKANMLVEYPNLNENLKNFIKNNDLNLNKFSQRILIEKNENLDEKHLNLIMKNRKSPFELTINLENYTDQTMNQMNSNRSKIDQPIGSSDQDQTFQSNASTVIDQFRMESIEIRFFKHKHATKEMTLSSAIISSLEIINELNTNQSIDKLTTKIDKLREVIDLIESCVNEYQTRSTNQTESYDEMKKTEIVQKASANLMRIYLSFMNFLYLERDKLVIKLRKNLFNLLKDWKEINSVPHETNMRLNLTFDEQNQFDYNEQAIFNKMIDERLEFERKFAQFNRSIGNFNQRIRTMFNRFVNKNSDSHENLIESQDNDETIYSRIKNKIILLDGRLPNEPRFFNFKLFYDQSNDSGNVSGNETMIDAENTRIDSKIDSKIKQNKYIVQIFNQKNLIFETHEHELDQHLQIDFTDIRFDEEKLFENSIVCNLIEIKGNQRRKQITKIEFNLEQILMQTLLHQNSNFSVRSNFSIKSLSGELILNLKRNESTSDGQQTNDLSNRFTIKYEFDDKKLNKFKETKDLNDELSDRLSDQMSDRLRDRSKDRIMFVMKMKNEIYNQKELNELLKIIRKNHLTDHQSNVPDDRVENKNLSPIKNDLFEIKPIELNQRLILLKQRYEDDDEFDKRRIHLYDSQYLKFLIKDQNQMTKSTNLSIELNQTNLNVDLLKAFDNQKKAVVDYLIDVRKKFINQSHNWNKNSKNYEDFVYEEIDTSLSTLNFDFLFFTKESKRPLKPNRKERKKYSDQTLIQQQLNTKTNSQANQTEKVKIMINVMSGLNIPVRKLVHNIKESIPAPTTQPTDLSSSQQMNQNYANFTKRLNELFHDEMHSYNSLDSVISRNIAIDLSLKEQKVCPFVEISFQNQTVQTSIAESNQPAWNQTIKLDLEVPNDNYSPSNLLKINDFISLNLFDQVEVMKDDELELEKKFNAIDPPKKYAKNWLGSINIPFITLYLNGKMDGTFCLNKPINLTDYDFETKPTFSLLTSGHNQELDTSYLNNLDSKKNSYLTLFLTIDPQLNLPSKIDFKCSTDEETVIYNYAKDWQSQLNKKYPTRLIKSLVINLINGKHTLITRFLSPLEPPTELLNTDQYNETIKDYKSILMKNLARYVSLIPVITTELSSIGLIEELIWADCEQFLKMNFGCVEEHAILLCNYFLYLGLNCGLVLGTSVQEGKSCWVIVWLNEPTKDDNFLNVQLWHPTTGQCYYVHTDSFLPLQSADCIVKKDNVYANIQKEDQPNQMSFNVSKMNCWKPLFNLGKLKVNLNTIQPNKFDYEPTNETYVRKLEDQIEIYLKESLMKWRRQKKTFFNRFCTKEIKQELKQMEYKTCFLKDSGIDPNEEINRLLSTYQINGIQLNLPFNGINQLTRLIYSTGLHLIANDKIDFVIAIRLHAYPQNVYSVWIYCAHVQTRSDLNYQ